MSFDFAALLGSVNMTSSCLEHVVDRVTDMVNYALIPHSSLPKGQYRLERSAFLRFVTRIVASARVKVPALLVTVLYISRAKLHAIIPRRKWANERVFMGALVLAHKVRCAVIPEYSPFLNLDGSISLTVHQRT